MTNRLMVALSAALMLGGAVYAQVPVGIPSGSPMVYEGTPGMSEPYPPLQAGPPAEPPVRFWMSGEYLLGWIYSARIPALVTTSPTDVPRAEAGVLGAPHTNVLYGGTRVNDDGRSGFRVMGGWMIVPECGVALEGGFRYLESQAVGFQASSPETPVLARPFLNALTDQPEAILVAFPGTSSGSIDIAVRSGTFYDAWLGLSEILTETDGWFRVDGILGYRYYRYGEGLRVRQSVTPAGPFVPGTQIVAVDDFAARNDFHGVDLGFRVEFTFDDFSLGLLAKVAGGNLRKEVRINGTQQVTAPGQTTIDRTGGFLALDSNIGTYVENDWALIPEFGLNFGWQVARYLRLNVGYSFLSMERIARAVDQIDTTINPELFPPALREPNENDRPALRMRFDDVWVQTINFGAEFIY